MSLLQVKCACELQLANRVQVKLFGTKHTNGKHRFWCIIDHVAMKSDMDITHITRKVNGTGIGRNVDFIIYKTSIRRTFGIIFTISTERDLL
jgi:hypothetical protein